jgi:hypothetical protein
MGPMTTLVGPTTTLVGPMTTLVGPMTTLIGSMGVFSRPTHSPSRSMRPLSTATRAAVATARTPSSIIA